MKFELESLYEIWDERGGRIEVGPDRDGLSLIEIRVRDESGKLGSCITLESEQAKLVVFALQKLMADKE
jgi:hypothetical protein